MVIFTGCPQTTVAIKLKQAQDLFNEASKQTILDEEYGDYIDKPEEIRSGDKLTLPSLTGDAKGKYQLVLELLETDVLTSNQLRPDLRINAYALKAVAEWRLKKYKKAINTADQGQRLCASGEIQNPRDCGILLIVGGLVVNSETLDNFEALKEKKPDENLTQEEAAKLVRALELALEQLGKTDSYDLADPIAIYANQQKLIVLGNIADIWSDYNYPKTEAERAEVREKAKEVCKRFPEDYPSKELTKKLAKNRLRLDQCGE